MAPLIVYGFPPSPPYRAVLLTAKALGLEVQIKSVNLLLEEQKAESFLSINPTHTIPTLDDNGFILWESRAIMAYLMHQYAKDDKLYPKEPKKRAVVDNMLYYDADCLFVTLQLYFLPLLAGKPLDSEMKEVAVERLGFLNTILGQRPYAAGDHLTIADFSIISTLSLAEPLDFNFDDFPNITKYAAKVRKEIAFYDEVSKEGADILRGVIASKLK